jgi:HSP20 family protein
MTRYRLSSPWYGEPWTAMGDLQRRMDALFDRFGGGLGAAPRAGVYPPVNLHETTDGYVLTAEIPGLRSEDVGVTVEGDRVTLSGERRIEHPEDASFHRRERRSGAFRRTLELPSEVDAEKVQAVYRNGVLVIRVPKPQARQPRRISVQA